MNIAIVGSRKYFNLELVRNFVYMLPKTTVIISGGAAGVDSMANDAAKYAKMKTIIFPAKWKRPDGTVDKSAGFKRNKLIVDASDLVVAFWDMSSRGTKHSIDLANAANKPCIIFDNNGRIVIPTEILKKTVV